MTRGTATKDSPVIVIGAGMGGLSAAIRLSAAGLPVTLLERHAWPGGKMRALPSAAGPVDAGPTVMTMRGVFDDLFAAAGTTLDAHVTLTPETVLARHWWPDGTTLDLSADHETSAAAVRSFGGPEAEAEFRAFCARARHLFDAFDGPVMRSPRIDMAGLTRAIAAAPAATLRAMAPGRTLAAALKGAFSDPRLRQLFGRYATYVGGSPFASPAILSLIWEAEARGVWRVQGGMHGLAQAMAGLARSLGAEIRLGAEVARIETADGRAASVHLADGERLAARAILYNGDPRALRRGFLGHGPTRAVRRSATEPRALSAWVWSFAATPSGRDLAHHNVFFGADPAAEFGPVAAGLLPEDPTLYVCAQDRGEGAAPARPERFEIIMNGAPRRAPVDRKEAERCRTLTFGTLERMGLSFAPPPGTEALTTPEGFGALFPGSLGALYGRSPEGMMASFLRPTARSRIPGLYLAGGGVHPGPGIPMAALSGSHAAAAIATDLASTSRWARMAMRGGMSTASPGTEAAPSRS